MKRRTTNYDGLGKPINATAAAVVFGQSGKRAGSSQNEKTSWDADRCLKVARLLGVGYELITKCFNGKLDKFDCEEVCKAMVRKNRFALSPEDEKLLRELERRLGSKCSVSAKPHKQHIPPAAHWKKSKVCPFCGVKRLNKDFNYCPMCGKKLP